MKLTACRAHYWLDSAVLHGAIVDQDRNVYRGSWPNLNGSKIIADNSGFPITPTQVFVRDEDGLIGLGEFGELLACPDETESDIDAEIEQNAVKGCTTLIPKDQPHVPLQAVSCHWIAHRKYGLLCHVFDQKQRLISTRWQDENGKNIKPESAKVEAQELVRAFRRGSRFRLVKRRGHLVIDDRRIPLWQIEFLNRQNDEPPQREFEHEKAMLPSRLDKQSETIYFASGFSLRQVK